MPTPDSFDLLGQHMASQHGLFTAAQAVATGLSRLAIDEAVRSDTLRRFSIPSVYLSAKAGPASVDRTLYAQWLLTEPASFAIERLNRSEGPHAIISHTCAAQFMRLVSAPASPTTMTCDKPVPVTPPGVSLIYKPFGPSEWALIHGLPVATAERVVRDVLSVAAETSLVAEIVFEALRRGLATRDQMVSAVSPFAPAFGFLDGDGESLVHYLSELGE